MKRIIPLLLCVALIVGLAVPASAAETDDSLYNVLDYASANDSGSNYFSYYSPYKVTYDLPASKFISYVDIVVWSVGVLQNIAIDMPSEDKDYEPQVLEPTLIYHQPDTDYYLYRFCGNIEFARFHAIELYFIAEVQTTKEYYAEIIQFDVGTMASGYDIPADYFMAEGSLLCHQLTESTNEFGITLSGSCEHEPGHTAPAVVNLYTVGAMYDKLSFCLYSFAGDFSDFSLMATNFDGEYIPCGSVDVQILAGESEFEWGDGAAVYLVTLDLSDVNLADDAVVQLTFLAYPRDNEWNIGFDSFKGYIDDNTTDSLYPYFYGIGEWLKLLGDRIVEALGALGGDFSGEVPLDPGVSDFGSAADTVGDALAGANDSVTAGSNLASGFVSSSAMTGTLVALGSCVDVFFTGNEVTICGMTLNPWDGMITFCGSMALISLVLAYVFRKRGDD